MTDENILEPTEEIETEDLPEEETEEEETLDDFADSVLPDIS